MLLLGRLPNDHPLLPRFGIWDCWDPETGYTIRRRGPSIEFPVISHKRSRSLVHSWEGERVWVPFMSQQRKEAKLSYSFP